MSLQTTQDNKNQDLKFTVISPQNFVNTITELLLHHCSKETVPSLNIWNTLNSPSDATKLSLTELLTPSNLLGASRNYDQILIRSLTKLCQSEPLLVNELIERTFDLFAKAAQFTESNLRLHESEHPYHIHKLFVTADSTSDFSSFYIQSVQQQQQQETEQEISNMKLVHRISVNNANALFIYFDSKSTLNYNDTLCFYADEQLCHLVQKYTYKNLPNNATAIPFYPLIVKEPHLWVTLEREIGRRPPILQQKATNWGWKFIVFPMHVSFNVAVWLLSFLIDHNHKELVATTGSYMKLLLHFFDFLLKYLIDRPLPQHIQQIILELLLHILHNHDTTEGDVAAFLLAQDHIQQHLKKLELIIQEEFKESRDLNSSIDAIVLCSPRLQSFIQFLTVVRKKQQDLLSDQKDSSLKGTYQKLRSSHLTSHPHFDL
jgi:hypothetical protein